MKKGPLRILLLTMAIALPACAVEVAEQPAAVKPAPKQELQTLDEKVSYMVGLDMGRNAKSIPAKIDVDLLVQGIRDVLNGREPLITEEEGNAIKLEFRAKVEADMKLSAEKNKTAGEAFLEQNKKVRGVVVTKSGLQYKVIRAGNGPQPTVTDRVKVHYVGTLLDGTEFDNSVKHGEPAVFDVQPVPGRQGVIKGWTEALQLMKVGSKYQVFIPAELAYNARPPRPPIEPNMALIFEIELLSIEPPDLTPALPAGGPPRPGQTPSPEVLRQAREMLNQRIKDGTLKPPK